MERGPKRSVEILERLAELVDAGAPLDVAALRAAFPGREEEIRWSLAGLEGYLEARRLLAASESLPPLLGPGERLADYEIVAAVGRGGMGEIYLARDIPLAGREVALKILRPAWTGAANRRRFEREARLLARLRHPSLAEVYRYGEEHGIPFISMRFIHGRSLRDWLTSFKTEPPPDLERIAVRWITQVADALAHVHANGLVHRDVKPTNIVVEGGSSAPHGGRAVLVDFGLVRPVDSLATTAPSPATLGYAPPEQILGQPIDARADVFSLGATLHDLLSLRFSIERERAASGLEPLQELRPGIERALAAIVSKAVDPDPRWRYRDGEALRTDLEHWSEGRAVSARRSPSVERVRRTILCEPRTVVKAGSIGLLVALLLLAGSRLRTASAHAEELRVALRSGDLAALSRAADGIAVWTRPLVFGPEDRETLTRLGRPGDPLREAVRLDLEGDSRRALRIAAISARTAGLATSPPLAAYLVRGLAEASPARLDALRSIARVFDERPDESPEELEASAPVRAALNELRQREISAEESFLVITALSGCGAAIDGEALLDWALESPETSERLRLGLCGVERILRRSIACGLPDAERFERVESKVASFFGALIEDRTAQDELWTRAFELADATAMLCRSLAFVRQALNGLPERPSELEALWARAFEARKLPYEQALAVLPAQRSQVFRPILLMAGVRRCSGWNATTTWEQLGFYWALGNDAPGLEGTRLLVTLHALRQGTLEPVADFRCGVLAGESFRLGRTPEHDRPDPDTRLGASFDSYSGELETQEAQGDALASWDFTRPRVEVQGAARGASVGECRVTENLERSHKFLKFSSFDSSWARLRFDLHGAGGDPALLELAHVIGARPHHAYAGVVALDLFLDGTFLDSVRLEMNRTVEYELRIGGDLLTPAEHHLEIRSNPATTTTYRLHRASLRRL